MLRESVSYIAAFMKGQGNKSPGCFVPGRAFPGTESHLEPSLATARGTAIFAPLDEISFTVEANTTEGFPNREGVLGLPTINVMRGARQDNTKRLKRDANLHLLDFALLKDATTQHFHDTLQPLGDDDWVLEYLALGWSNESVPIKDNGYLKVAVTSLRIRGVSDFPHGLTTLIQPAGDDSEGDDGDDDDKETEDALELLVHVAEDASLVDMIVLDDTTAATG